MTGEGTRPEVPGDAHTVADGLARACRMEGLSAEALNSTREQHEREIRLLTDLVRELVGFGLQVGMSDAGPAAFIRSAAGRLVVVIAVSGDYFEWKSGNDSHLVTDPAGAAAAIAAHVWTKAGEARAARRPGNPGGAS
ncbi:hypothetical protein NE236_35580 [Actinoallomurus purpureus]|uniref:hypothetical protein n=1 Tax=Actinoallomurus purpureus TaxID=478114 RepID=UPI0020931395|nr:hypothetical protein [Actinoallomurus purpureus]MCO6010300.1 hypothetical protein [Actinoallomurus purpureus]